MRVLGLLLLLLCLSAPWAEAKTKTLENVNVQRNIVLFSQVMRETLTFDVKNHGSEPASTYDLTIDPELLPHLAFLEPKVKKTSTKLAFDVAQEEDGHTIHRLVFPKPLEHDESIIITVTCVYTHVLEPFPKEVAQNEKQKMQFTGNYLYYSPYPTLKTKTTFVFPNEEVTYVGPGLTLSGDRLSFGPSSVKTEPYARKEVIAHFTSNSGFLLTKSLLRTLEVSHWGDNIAYEEYYSVTHDGAKLKGFYSRLDYDRAVSSRSIDSTSAVSAVSLNLPVGATDVYYRDIIGNISTSNFRATPFESVLELRFRYPMFGGWNNQWYHGYNVPLSSSLEQKEDGKYLLNFLFVAPYEDAVIDELTLLVTLPEGAIDVQFHPTTNLDVETSMENIKTYLDTYGRPVVRVTKKNVVNDHQIPVQVSYRYPKHLLLQEPFILFVFYFCLFTLGMVISRLDLSIAKDALHEQKEKCKALWYDLVEKEESRRALFKAHDDAYEKFKTEKDKEQYKAAREALEKDSKAIDLHISDIQKKLHEFKDPLAAKVDDLKRFASERWARLSNLQQEASKGKKNAEEELRKFVGEVEKKVEGVLQQFMEQ